MGVFRANVGNLMQHWTLCEITNRLLALQHRSLSFISTHSMAPWSVPRSKTDQYRAPFESARLRLHSKRPSLFENCWRCLSIHHGLPYPSSAVFIHHQWSRSLSLKLCEIETSIADEIEGWISALPDAPHHSVHRGDWRDLFNPAFTLPKGCDLLFIELDPYKFERNTRRSQETWSPGVLYIDDLQDIVEHIGRFDIPVVLQISSYDSRNNRHGDSEQAITEVLSLRGFVFQGSASPNGHMISWVYASSGLAFWQKHTDLGESFDSWFSGIE